MWNPISDDAAAADFWPPKPHGVWRRLLSPLRKFYLRNFYAVPEVSIEGLHHLASIPEGDGVLLTPNHSHDSDPHVMMELAHRLGRQFYFMAAWQIFKGHKGIDGFVLQRMGAFSVDREGCDRRAMRQATELLTTGQWLVVFPEGEIYRTNDRLTPLREGVAFMATTAAKDLAKAATGGTVRIVPTAIRYHYIEDVTPKLEEAMDGLEDRMMLRRLPAGTPLRDRILRFGDAMLTLKEKEQLGHSNTGDLAPRLKILVTTILDRLEIAWLKKSLADESVSMRVKTLRQHLIEKWIAQDCTTEQRSAARAALDDVQLVMQLYSYPGDYVTENPTLERMAETVEKFEEDVYGGVVRPKGPRAARVILAPPIDVAAETATLRPRAAATQLTAKLETTIKTLMGSS
jgi:1-acyl-sn-glycerol-3-phosphate acyltransferase